MQRKILENNVYNKGVSMNRQNSFLVIVFVFFLFPLQYISPEENSFLFQDDFNKEKISSDWKIEGRWEIVDGAITNTFVEKQEEKYYTGKITVGNKDWRIEKVEFDFKRIEQGLPTKYGFDNHTGICIWGLTIWAGENYLYWSGHIPPTENKPAKTEKKEAIFELNKWYHFKAERVSDSKVQIFINDALFTIIPYAPIDSGPISFYTYRIRSSFDNVKIYEAKGDKEIKKSSYNFVPNSSFEYTTNPSMPDFWTSFESLFSWGLYNEKWTSENGYKEWHKKFQVDRTTAFDGENSIKITYPLDLSSTSVGVQSNREYNFSAYLKSEKDNFPVKMGIIGNDRKIITEQEIVIGKNWERHFLHTSSIKVGNIYLYFIPLKEGTFWVDAVQLEIGAEPTRYSPSPLDETIFKKMADTRIPANLEIPKVVLEEKGGKIVLDAKLDEECWKKVQPLVLKQMDGKEATEKTEVYLCYDEENLYIGVKSFDSKMDTVGIVGSELKRDSFEIFGQDSIEIFLTPNETGEEYFQLVANTLGSKFDQKLSKKSGMDLYWDGNWNVKVEKYDKCWIMEISIPFENFIKESMTMGNVWRFNICRNHPRTKELISWSPTLTGFHVPDRFGYLYLGSSPMLWEIKNITLKWFSPEKKRLSFTIRNGDLYESVIDIKLFLEDQSFYTYPEKLNLKPNEEKTVFFTIPAEKQEIKGNIKIQDIRKGKLLLSKEIKVTSLPVLEAYLDRSYYTNENEAVLYLTVNIYNELLKNVYLNCKILGNNFTKKIRVSSEKNTIVIPIKNLTPDNYKIITEIEYENTKFPEAITELVKLPPNIVEVKIDRIKDTILVNGEPFFIFAPFWEHPPGKETLKYIAKCGFKSIVIVWRPGNKKEEVMECLNTAKENGLWVIAWPSPSGMHLTEKGLNWLISQINEFKDHPAIIAWYVFDEPGHDGILQKFVDEAKKADPYRIAAANYHSFALNLKIGGMPGEIISLDRYPIPEESIYSVESTVKEMYKISSSRKNPLWYILQNLGYAFASSRCPTPLEQEYMTYITILEGARGLMYFTGLSKSIEHQEKIENLNKEIQELTSILFSPEDVPTIQVFPQSIKYMLKKYKGYYYLISLNREECPIKSIFNLSSLKPKIIETMFENRKIKLEGDRLEDTFEGYQRHVYKIKGE